MSIFDVLCMKSKIQSDYLSMHFFQIQMISKINIAFLLKLWIKQSCSLVLEKWRIYFIFPSSLFIDSLYFFTVVTLRKVSIFARADEMRLSIFRSPRCLTLSFWSWRGKKESRVTTLIRRTRKPIWNSTKLPPCDPTAPLAKEDVRCIRRGNWINSARRRLSRKMTIPTRKPGAVCSLCSTPQLHE